MGRTRSRFAVWIAVLILTITTIAAGAQSTTTLDRISFTGSIGQDRVGMVLDVDTAGKVIGGHLFYAKDLKDIPLKAGTQGTGILLYEPEGGQFALRLKGNGSEAGKPLDFNNSVGLEGRWMKGASSYPVKLAMQSSQQIASSNARWYEDVTTESDANFEAKVQDFYNAVLNGDKTSAAKFVDFPLRVNHNGKSRQITSAAELSAQWDQIFTSACIDAFRKAMPHDMFVRNGMAMLGDGVAWIGAKGVQSINVP
ncbi:MAG TPA: hypothetical protein VFE38_08865 [Edaphobacter sp.]|nr:hypothetical protein [Edaphobacter sp.]